MAEEKSNLKERKEEIEALVLEVQEGEHQAFASLYDVFIDPIYRYVYYRVKSEDVDDIVETVFLKVWEHIRKYKREKKASFSAWIFKIAHNAVVDHYRSTKNKETDSLDFAVPDHKREHNPIRVTEDVIDKKILRTAVNKLKKNYRDVIVYKFLNDFSNAEIAEILDRSEGSLRILQFRALKALRNELQQMGVNYDI